MRAFLGALRQTQERYPFALFAYPLTTNHFHLVLGPGQGLSIRRILQSLRVAHTWRYHRQHRGVGRVWQGRFKSPDSQDDNHLLMVLLYLENNPWCAGMVTDLKDYPCSSYAHNGLPIFWTPIFSPTPFALECLLNIINLTKWILD